MKVAIVHPFLISQGGGEKVVDALATLYPQADLFTMMLDRNSLSPALRQRSITSTWLDRVPRAHRYYQQLSPLFDMAMQSIDVSAYDLVVSSGGPGVKNIVVGQGARHIHYCHSPVRFLWDQYHVWRARLPQPARSLFSASAMQQRERDFNAAQRVDSFVANSDFIGRRIAAYYRRDSVTIYPPVDVPAALPARATDDYYLTVGRLVPGKRTELLVDACNRMQRRLHVAGGGPEEARLRSLAGPTVSIEGRVSDARLAELFRGARAFLFSAEEDFGIATVEAQAHGLPVIGYGVGGTAEIVRCMSRHANPTGLLFAEQSVNAVSEAIESFEREERAFDAQACWTNSQRFAPSAFADAFRAHAAGTTQSRRAV